LGGLTGGESLREEGAMSGAGELFSLVVPVLNEEALLRDTYERLTAVLEGIGMPYEVVVVDNGSTDATPAIAAAICAEDGRWRYLRLSRNFGLQNSLTAGMLAAAGDAIMVIDADLQDPPEMIPQFIARWREGYDVVYGVREKRTGEPFWRVLPTMAAMRFITWMSDDFKLPLNSGDFRLISRRVRDALARLPENNRYLRGLIHWLGFRQHGIPYVRLGRTKGHGKHNMLFLVRFAFEAVFNFSVKPLRVFSLLGLGLLGLTAVLAAVYLLSWCFVSEPPGWTTLALLTLVNLGVQTTGIGILGEYVARIYAESKRRPLWLVDYTINLDADRLAGPAESAAPPAVYRKAG
jgi:dolichol-phosphate mannosyltransferase